MGKSWVENIGDSIPFDVFKKYFVRFEIKDSGVIEESFFEIVDGVEKPIPKIITIGFLKHIIKAEGLQALYDFMCGRIGFSEICKRADDNNKLIIGYLGKRGKSEKTFLTKCTICGHVSKLYMRFFNRCYGCNKIARTKTFDIFLEQAKLKHDDRYDYPDGEYVNAHEKIRIFCKKCKVYFYQAPRNHLEGCGCPKCNESKGEKRVARYLKKRGIAFEPQQEFKDLKHKSYLKFDFYFTELNILLEYDGEHHYKPVYGSTPEEMQKRLDEQKIRDRLKDEWAKANNIPLLRIPYWDFNRIEELTEAFILKILKERESQQLTLEI